MSFFTQAPEIISQLMYSGAGSGPMLEASNAWNGLAAELGAAAESFSSLTSNLASQAWQGAASAAMLAAASPYAAWLNAASTQATGAATQAQTVASVFESALSSTVHPLEIDANRTGFVQAVMTNIFGQNAPVIAALEGFYEEFWAQDITAMVGYYSGAAAAAAQLVTEALPSALSALPELGGGLMMVGGLAGQVGFGLANAIANPGAGAAAGAGAGAGAAAAGIGTGGMGAAAGASAAAAARSTGFPTSAGYFPGSGAASAAAASPMASAGTGAAPAAAAPAAAAPAGFSPSASAGVGAAAAGSPGMAAAANMMRMAAMSGIGQKAASASEPELIAPPTLHVPDSKEGPIVASALGATPAAAAPSAQVSLQPAKEKQAAAEGEQEATEARVRVPLETPEATAS